MPCTEAYREHIMYTFNGYCKTVIRFAALNAWRDRSRRRQKEISLEYLTEEKFYPLGTTDEYFEAPYEEWFFLNFGYDSTAIKPSDKCSDGLIYIRSIRVKSLVLIRKASLHFLVRLTILDLPYTIRLMSLNLLLFPSTNPELTSMDIAFLTEEISFFKLLQKEDSSVSAYLDIVNIG